LHQRNTSNFSSPFNIRALRY